jgi:hypothetical protein
MNDNVLHAVMLTLLVALACATTTGSFRGPARPDEQVAAHRSHACHAISLTEHRTTTHEADHSSCS